MDFHKPTSPDLTRFSTNPTKPEALYGLPPDVKFCARCVVSNQRPSSVVEYQNKVGAKKPTIQFDAEGVCSACRVADQKKKIDWAEREKELWDLCNRFRRSDGQYDCLVPGSGGKDSFYASHILKYKFGMHPLTVTWAPHVYTEWGWKNFQSWIHAGFDNYLHTPNGRVHRVLTRLATEILFHPFQPFFFGQKSLAPRLGYLMNIPLIFYGENEAEYGNPLQSYASARQDQKYFAESDPSKIHLAGVSLAELQEKYGLDSNDLTPYLPFDPQKLEDKQIQVHYLGYYLRWHPQSCYYYSVENGGFVASPERTPGTYSKYASIDDKIDDLNFYATFIKFGIGRATYDAAQEIRSGDITREEGVALVKRFDGEFPERFIQDLLSYLSLPEKEFPEASRRFEQPILDRFYFEKLVDRFRSPHLWRHADGKWELRHKVWA